jgi:iron complex transport system substrate-binding protein
MSRRSFIQFASACTVTLAAGATLANLAGCDSLKVGADAAILGEQTIIDDTGRELVIPTPDRLERVYFTSALAQIYCFSMAPELLGGIASTIGPDKMKYLPAGIENLPNMGTLSGESGRIDREMLLKQRIQIVFSISAVALTEQNRSEAEELQEATGIPVVLIDGSFEVVSNAYRLLGQCMGREQRGEEIAAYLEDILARVTEAVSDIPEEEKINLYYAEGPLGLQTEPSTAQHALVFIVAGAHIVADVEGTAYGMSDVSLEQVLAWNPEVIIAWSEEFRGGSENIIRTNQNWAPITAVKTGRVYTMPENPFAWLDRPPAVNRFLGLQWIANMLYPERYDVDMVKVAKEFYEVVYWVDNVTEEEIREMLGNSYPPYEA